MLNPVVQTSSEEGVQVEIVGGGTLLTLRELSDPDELSGSLALMRTDGTFTLVEFHTTVDGGWMVHPPQAFQPFVLGGE